MGIKVNEIFPKEAVRFVWLGKALCIPWNMDCKKRKLLKNLRRSFNTLAIQTFEVITDAVITFPFIPYRQ